MIKGGVWKNTEDEILKAAVMKYGKNQWARVASLLNRKSAKQCKARWYEWLDPSIKKTEWTREEEEKLLHLAKIYPSQWRTIAPIVGRTAAQCMEHYEQLLDAAQEASGDIEGGTDDPRRLRPGEIDPHPETKPARPDPIDMDEDEKEMLAEARARLANTRGKKAKRKAREKQLEEAKRLATMQKRRELKAAGVTRGIGRRKRKYVDYRREIPFQRLVPAGFYDVAGEKERSAEVSKESADKDVEVARLDQMENKRRDKEEKEEQRKDRKKLRKMEKMNPGQVVSQISQANDPSTIRRRTPLSLPKPQVTDGELEEVVKVGAAGSMALPVDGSDSTSALMGDYPTGGKTPTPMRTPRLGSDVVLQEARNLIALTAQQTPLLGGANPDLKAGTGFAGVTPRSQELVTPNSLMTPASMSGATPLRGTPMSSTGGNTPQRTPGGGGGATPLSTPLRDELGVNEVTNMDAGAAHRQKAQLQMGLGALPEPQYQYEIEVPEVQPEAKDAEGATMVEDAEEIGAREAKAKAIEKDKQLARRSGAVKKALPRPSTVDPNVARARDVESELGKADGLVRTEMVRLLQHDANKHPFKQPEKGKKKKRRKTPALQKFEDEELGAARALVAAELDVMEQPKSLPDAAVLSKLWEGVYSEVAYLPERKAYDRLTGASAKERLSSLQHEFEALRGHMTNHAARASKHEEKLKVKMHGYQMVAEGLRKATIQSHVDLKQRTIDYGSFAMLFDTESKALPQRYRDLEALAQHEKGHNMKLQREYADLVRTRDLLLKPFLPPPPPLPMAQTPAPAAVQN
eukprot:CAMPEP_0185745974 /NCGR_PEP_ID=MMETSP1174-20130828/4361_1 /TAXON_ID=35687 /ORGANISM="Dictyocha speculum, Strain CCMP1381" /LENGTH=802 /DNA_ID=CAMNT_0028420291 /DNA_START=76 /DNA_END=2484 /DNA_ORIENTATION=+